MANFASGLISNFPTAMFLILNNIVRIHAMPVINIIIDIKGSIRLG